MQLMIARCMRQYNVLIYMFEYKIKKYGIEIISTIIPRNRLILFLCELNKIDWSLIELNIKLKSNDIANFKNILEHMFKFKVFVK